MEITQDFIYMTMGITSIVSLIIAYLLHKKNIHFPFL